MMLISLLAASAQADSFLSQADIISTVNPILAVKSLAKQNPDKVAAIAASFAKRFPDAAPDIAATLAREFPDQATEIARAVADALAGKDTRPVISATPKTPSDLADLLNQDLSGKDVDIARTGTIDNPYTPFDPEGGQTEPEFFPFPSLVTPGRPIITGGSNCMEVCLAGRNCPHLEPCVKAVTPNRIDGTCSSTLCNRDYCEAWCASYGQVAQDRVF
ncbi:MAG: hypothetical protein ABFS56_17465 [Pseudomonadota bacterium]